MTLLEKYRPRKLDDVFGQSAHVELMEQWIEDRDIPHLLIHGPYGNGKSSFTEASLRDFYGKYYDNNTVIKNASQQSVRGIGAMDEIITHELGILAQGDFPFRIIVFEEAEQITEHGQRSLKRAIEQYAHNTRFIFLTNFYELMDGGIMDRCVSLKFIRPTDKEIKEWLIHILNLEEMRIDTDAETAIDAIVSSKVSPREALKRLGMYISGGSMESTTTLMEKSNLIVGRLFASLKDKIPRRKLYGGLMDIYDSIRPDFSSPERQMLGFIFMEADAKFRKSHPTVLGELSKAIAATDIALLNSMNSNIHISNLFWKLSKAFGI